MTRGRAYGVIAAALVVFGSPVLSILASVQIAENSTERLVAERILADRRSAERVQRAKEEVEAKTRAEARQTACDYINLNLDVYEETPPVSAAGRNLRAKYLELHVKNECGPARK